MSIQSPKSQRASAPGESPASDTGVGETINEHVVPQRHASGPETPSVPAGLDKGPAGHQGNVEAEDAVETHAPAPHQGGGPGFAKDKGDAERKGGTVHQT